jgi:predicted amidohydrolase
MSDTDHTDVLRVAAAQYPIERFAHWSEYAAKIERMAQEAVQQGARLLLMPEYASMELASLLPSSLPPALASQMEAMQSLLEPFQDLHRGIAIRYGVFLVAGTFPVRQSDGRYRNRALLFTPGGESSHQDKLQLTRFERELELVQEGEACNVFETAVGTFGIAICYDSEFPTLVRRQVEAGAELVLVPSCTDTLAGFYRVHLSARARALENQCYVVQAPTVGRAEWSEAVDVNIGYAGVFGPVDRGFPDDGVLATGELNRAQWVCADLQRTEIRRVREHGQVQNHLDWARLDRPPGVLVQRVRL